MTNLSTDFKIDHNENRGIYYEETKRCIIYLPMHETIADVLKTIDHEVYHHCFTVLEESDDMDEDQEERLIFNLQWAEIAC
tara:strand:+ start:320 stop:562 length:243 start_codon:yes stop_codon:yes gene_type:complete